MTQAALHTKPPHAAGKQKLIEAALRVCARDGVMLSSLGLRELARDAGLNHNTFYRHFGNIEELAEAAAGEIATQIMAGMKDVRARSEKHADATIGAVEYFLDFVQRSPAAFIVGLRELHGGTPRMRGIFLKVIDFIAQESVEQITSMNLAPGLSREVLLQTTTPIAHYMFYRARDLIDHPAERARITDEMVGFIRTQFFGALALQGQAERNAHLPGKPAR
jgi:TetR/AcrR family transcriptional regulator, fatty acid biosynthesis regulator